MKLLLFTLTVFALQASDLPAIHKTAASIASPLITFEVQDRYGLDEKPQQVLAEGLQ